jgi:mRNA interferase RelE/StbE
MADRDPPRCFEVLRKLGRKDRERIQVAIGKLPDGDVKRLRGPERLWRLRVGEWRIIFDRRAGEHVIDVLAIGPRGRAYERH